MAQGFNDEPSTVAARMPQSPTILPTTIAARPNDEPTTLAAPTPRITTTRPTMGDASFQRRANDVCRAAAATVNEPPMNTNEQCQAFDALVRQHVPARPPKLRMLMELRDSIAEARKKGASYEVIRSYLRKTAVIVSADTIARFCHQVLAEPQGRRVKGKRKARSPHVNGASAADVLQQKRLTAPPPARYQAPSGPRIVDPKSL
jgi:hypothetical protein